MTRNACYRLPAPPTTLQPISGPGTGCWTAPTGRRRDSNPPEFRVAEGDCIHTDLTYIRPQRGFMDQMPEELRPEGLHRTPRRRTHGILETRSWTPFPNFLGGASYYPYAQSRLTGGKAVTSIPTANSVSRDRRGPMSGPHEPPPKRCKMVPTSPSIYIPRC